MWYAVGLIALAIVIALMHSNRKAAMLEEAHHEYEKNEYALEREAARAQCKHEFIEFGQTGVPGIHADHEVVSCLPRRYGAGEVEGIHLRKLLAMTIRPDLSFKSECLR